LLGQLIGLAGYVALFGTLLFVPARTLDWPDAWILLAVLLIVRGVSAVQLWRTQRGLMERRSGVPLPQKGQPAADRILLPLAMASFAGLVAFTSLDVWHLHLLPSLPLAVRPAGLLLFASGWWLAHLALRENAFALTVVRHQEERDHRVVDTGPYAVVRHPMYTGMMIVMVGLGLWLGSLAGVLATVVPIAILALRIVVEERVLREALPAYSLYAERVRARLLPGLW
jgi:protein-S-isoprenylcysteine O-methyltransferase Ste14